MSKTLVVGGPHDGHWVEADTRREMWELAVETPLPKLSWEAMAPTATTERALYKRRIWRCAGRDSRDHSEWFLWAPPDMHDADVFERLMSNYRPKQAGRSR